MSDQAKSGKEIHTVTVKLFGNLVDATGKNELKLDNISDTDSLHAAIRLSYPFIEKFNFAVALNKQVVNGNHIIHEQDEIALLPPFSGG